MTAAAKRKKVAPDMERLKALSAEVDQLRAADKWDLADWQRIMHEANEAVGDEGYMLEAFMNMKP
jgi:hypothetical protein